MNVFEKYIDNITQNKKLTDIINKLCTINLISRDPIESRITNKHFDKFIRWEINENDSQTIEMFYTVKNSEGEIIETSMRVKWSSLLIKIDGYE